MNVYIGPETPSAEREEWPSQWAATRHKPLVACEHGLFLVPYWFRHRAFPLSDVYASEPLFEEFGARRLGPRAYEMLSPDVFELYALGDPKRGRALKPLVARHPAYQTVKADVVARHSLRAWRTYGVSGIIFMPSAGTSARSTTNPARQARLQLLQRPYVYLAGPAGDARRRTAYYSGDDPQTDRAHQRPDDGPSRTACAGPPGRRGRINRRRPRGAPSSCPGTTFLPLRQARVTAAALHCDAVGQPAGP